MKGKSYSIPFDMVFKKYYCSKCGTKLEKEKTHRVVTKYDKDYYQYHEYGTFPQRDYDVYSYQFKCPSCHARMSYDEQCIVEKIQKKQGCYVLSSSEMKENVVACREANNRKISIRTVLFPIIFNLIAFTLFYLFVCDRTLADLAKMAILFTIITTYTVFTVVRKHKGLGNMKVNRSYSYEKESQMKRLHAYRSHNKQLINDSDKCYCFHCKTVMESSEIESYIDEGQTALCPKCGIDSIIPDSIDETVNESIISEMHDYWF